MQVDIYDFDKTVVPFDSALKYWGFCMVHNPWIILLLPFQFIWGMMMLMHIISVRTCKKVAFLYIRLINNEKNVNYTINGGGGTSSAPTTNMGKNPWTTFVGMNHTF